MCIMGLLGDFSQNKLRNTLYVDREGHLGQVFIIFNSIAPAPTVHRVPFLSKLLC
jgi:hypothetical protein